MKLSSRKELLKESDWILREIKKNIRENKLNEDVNVKNLLTNIVNSIVFNVSKWINTGRQAWLQYKMPYLMGLDLVNNRNLNVDRKVLKVLDTYIKSIIKDVRSSPELKIVANELKQADRNVTSWRNIIDIAKEHRSRISVKLTKRQIELYNSAPIEYEKAVKVYNELLFEKVAGVVEKIIRKNSQYKNFDKIVSSVLKSGIQGITDKELEQVKNNYIKTISQRAAQMVDEYDIEHELTIKQSTEKEREKVRDRGTG